MSTAKIGLVGCLIFFQLCFSAGLSALTWQEVLKRGAEASDELQSARKGLEAVDWSYRQAFSSFMPQLSATVSLTGSGTADARTYSYGLSATQRLFSGGDNFFSAQRAYVRLEKARADLQTTQAAFFYDLRAAFVGLLTAEENVSLLEKILQKREENSRLVWLRYQGGKEDKGNLLRTEADEASARHDLSFAKRQRELFRLKLSQLLGGEVVGAVQEEERGGMTAVNLDELYQQIPAYISARKQLELAELEEKKSWSGFLPSLSLSGSYSRRDDSWPPDNENLSWSLNFSCPLFSGGSNIAARAIAVAQREEAESNFSQTAKNLRYTLSENWGRYQDAEESLAVARLALAASEEQAKIAQAKYLNGLILYDEWDRMENAYIQAQKNLLNSKKNLLLAEALWHKTYGGWVK